MMMWYGGNFGSFGMIFAMIFQVIFWIAIVRVIFTLIQGGKSSRNNNEDEAINLLRKKYANGEISKKEYLERKKDLLT